MILLCQSEQFSPISTNFIINLSGCDTDFSLKPCIKLDYAGTELLLEISLFANSLHFLF